MSQSRRIDRLGSSIFERNDLRKNFYRNYSNQKELPPLFDLSLGSSDLLPPENVLEAIRTATRNSGSSSYSLHASTRPFREEVATWTEKRFGVKVDPDSEVIFLVGSQEGIAHLPLALLDPGDTGLILDPCYPSHRGGLVLADAKIQKLLLKEEEEWRPKIRSITTNQWDQIGMMIFGFPHNPTAQVGEQSLLDEVMHIGVKNQVVIAHDNPYVDLALEGEAPVLLRSEGWREYGIEFFSFSKGWCLGGYRLAFAIGSESIVSALRSVKGVVDFNQSLALQAGAINALAEFPDWPKQILNVYRERRDRTIKSLKIIGWDLPTPSMAIYLWMPLPAWAKEKGWGDEDLVIDLLDKTGISLTPGSGFGDGGSGWLRLALVRPIEEMEEAISRMGPWWDENS